MRNSRIKNYKYYRQRRVPTGRGKKIFAKIFVWGLLVFLSVGGLFLGHKFLGQIDFFQIAAIEIQGCDRLAKAEVLELSGIDIHSNLVAVNSSILKKQLETHDWIAVAEINKKWPDRLVLSIKEREPVSMVNLDGELHYVDRRANVFARLKPEDNLDFPLISGLSRGARSAEQEASLSEALLFIKYVKKNNPNLPLQNISELKISEKEIVLFLMDRPFPIRLGRGDMYKKYKRLAKVLYRLYKNKEFNRTAYIQVDYSDDKVLVGRKRG